MNTPLARLLRFLFPLLLLAALTSCGGGGNSSGTSLLGSSSGGSSNLSGSTGSTTSTSSYAIVVSAAATSLSSGQTTAITATVTDNGNPVAGQTLSFVLGSNLSGASLGTASAVTDTNGVASVSYTAGTVSGTDRVVVTSAVTTSGVTSTVVGSVPITVAAVSGGTQYRIALNAAASANLNVGASTELLATVTDASGTPVSNATVHFSLSTSVTGGALGASTAVTGTGNGVAGVLYTAGSVAGTDIVTASVTDASGNTATASLAVNVSGGNTTNVTLSLVPVTSIASPVIVAPNGACGGAQTVNQFQLMTVTVTNSDGTAATGVTVTFTMGSVTSSASEQDACSTATPKPLVLVSAGLKSSSATVQQTLSTTVTDATGTVYEDYVSGGLSGSNVFDTVIVTVTRSGVVLASRSMLVNVN